MEIIKMKTPRSRRPAGRHLCAQCHLWGERHLPLIVMRGLVPRIPLMEALGLPKRDGRVGHPTPRLRRGDPATPGHDGGEFDEKNVIYAEKRHLCRETSSMTRNVTYAEVSPVMKTSSMTKNVIYEEKGACMDGRHL